MARKRSLTIWSTGILLMALVGCAPHKIYRTNYSLCTSSDPVTECQEHALQEYDNPAEPDDGYFLGFIEFDDQGQIFDRAQMWAVLDYLNGKVGSDDLLMIVFVHGWKHNAAPLDGNIETFRHTLSALSATESAFNRDAGRPDRRVAGIYIGWRGASITWPVLEQITFWDRKNTAHKVGRGGVMEVLSRLELIQLTKDSMVDSERSGTRLVVVGHSFGGAVVYSAVPQVLEERLVHTVGPAGTVGNARGFGDLVVLINPAFEALRFTPLSDMSTERGTYFPDQLPVLAILTSEADSATGTAFPMGRWFSTLFEKERTMTRKNGVTREQESIDQRDANVTAVGHFDPYRTHYLAPSQGDDTAIPQDREQMQALAARQSVELFNDVRQQWRDDRPGSRIEFYKSVLERTTDSAGRNPYLLIRVNRELIHDHNHITDPRVIEFIKQLILISSRDAGK